MTSKFIPARSTPMLAKLKRRLPPVVPVGSIMPTPTTGIDITTMLPQIAPPKPIIPSGANSITRTSDRLVRVMATAPVHQFVQPEASMVGPTVSEIGVERNPVYMSTVNPIDRAIAIRGFGESLAVDKLAQIRHLYDVRAQGTPWLTYALYGVGAVAVAGIAYLLLFRKPSAAPNRRRARRNEAPQPLLGKPGYAQCSLGEPGGAWVKVAALPKVGYRSKWLEYRFLGESTAWGGERVFVWQTGKGRTLTTWAQPVSLLQSYDPSVQSFD